jgi:hypothetical protein
MAKQKCYTKEFKLKAAEDSEVGSASLFRTPDCSSRPVTSSCQCRRFSNDQWPHKPPANSFAESLRLMM